MHTREHPAISGPKGWIELGLKTSKIKGVWVFWVGESSYGRMTGKSTVNKGCLVRCVLQMKLVPSSQIRAVKSPPLPGVGE